MTNEEMNQLALTLKGAELAALKENGLIRDYTDPVIKGDTMYFNIVPIKAAEFIEIKDFVIN